MALLLAAALLVTNALFVAAEYALVRVRETQLRQEAERGSRTAKLALRMVHELDEYISAIQVGVTAASLGLGYVGEPTVFALIEQILPDAEAIAGELLHSLAFIVSFAMVTFVTLVIGELAPKYLTLRSPLAVLRVVALPLLAFATLVRPFVWLVRVAALATVRPFGIRRMPPENAYSEEELRLLLAASARSGVLKPSEQEIVHRAFDFADTPVRRTMVPRTELTAIEASATIAELVDLARTRGFARYPVFRGTLDQVIGFAHVHEIVSVPPSEWSSAKVTRVMRRAVSVPESLGIDRALATMRAERTTMLLVVDEFGGTAGIVSLTDFVEQLIGEVRDDIEPRPEPIQRRDDKTLVVSGLTSLDELDEEAGTSLEAPEYDTVGGLVFGKLGRVPKVGDSVEVGGTRFEVTALDGRRVAEVLVRLPQPR